MQECEQHGLMRIVTDPLAHFLHLLIIRFPQFFLVQGVEFLVRCNGLELVLPGAGEELVDVGV